jgi:hypothetical protein
MRRSVDCRFFPMTTHEHCSDRQSIDDATGYGNCRMMTHVEGARIPQIHVAAPICALTGESAAGNGWAFMGVVGRQ